VYRPNIDKLVERPVLFKDGGWVLLHTVMTNTLEDSLKSMPYFMSWRFTHSVSLVLFLVTQSSHSVDAN
jgi:hypothetical protein